MGSIVGLNALFVDISKVCKYQRFVMAICYLFGNGKYDLKFIFIDCVCFPI